ncbi:Uncharacterised protein [Bacillus freudenreichii]|nr:Uncharacterised protein [Bacillus freudenreichii]
MQKPKIRKKGNKFICNTGAAKTVALFPRLYKEKRKRLAQPRQAQDDSRGGSGAEAFFVLSLRWYSYFMCVEAGQSFT